MSIDDKMIKTIEEKFQYKRELAKAREEELFGIFNKDLTEDETLALKYLYAYMPLNDLADYEGELFLSHVKQAFEIQKNVAWGSKITPELFLHFILPYRVNNENIEDTRGIFFEELYPRVKDLSMEDAILETNHWAHEKANYIGNDGRTVSPLTLIRTALGRCGEQSTLAVAALRSIGIPARQVYTPLWAHSDSNHAWVEAWADGQWYFFGACEPEPKLNQGWFQNPARRAMLLHTRLAANYPGPEEVTLAHPWYSELNLTSLYAKTKELTVRVTDADGKPAQGKVHFQLFNFGSIRTILTMETDVDGKVNASFGLGDLYLSVTSDDRKSFGFLKCSVEDADEITVQLTTEIPTDKEESFEMVPPPNVPEDSSMAVSDEEKEAHDKRTKEGAQIRSNFESTFLTEADAEKIATAYDLPKDRVWKVLKSARGNSYEIAAFIQEYAPAFGEWALKLLEVLNPKDLTDTFRPTLADHLIHAMGIKEKHLKDLDDELFSTYILRPRIDSEMITPYRAYFQEVLEDEAIESFIGNPARLVDKINLEFEVLEDLTFYRGSATPKGSYQLKKGDQLSRDIMFIAFARSIGIAARLNPNDRRPEYYVDGDWQYVIFDDKKEIDVTDQTKTSDETGTAVWKKEENDGEIEYMKNFTIARFSKGVYQSLFYKFDEKEQESLELPVGNYRVTTNTRLKDGTTLVYFRYFEVKANEEVNVVIKFPKDTSEVPIIGDANIDFDVESAEGKPSKASDETAKDGTTFVWLEPDREPSKHLLRELREMKANWEKLDIRINCFVSEEKWSLVDPLISDDKLPTNVKFFKEKNTHDALEAIGEKTSTAHSAETELPVVYVLDRDQKIRHTSEGYKLGISKDVIDVYQQILS